MLDIESSGETRPGRVLTRSNACSCAGCGRKFTAARPHQRFCDVFCRRRSWRAAQESSVTARRVALLERVLPDDPGRAE